MTDGMPHSQIAILIQNSPGVTNLAQETICLPCRLRFLKPGFAQALAQESCDGLDLRCLQMFEAYADVVDDEFWVTPFSPACMHSVELSDILSSA